MNKIRKITKNKYFKITAIILGLYFAVIYSAKIWVNYSLPKILNKNPNQSYQLHFESMDFSIWNRSIDISNATILPTENKKDTKKAIIYSTVKLIHIKGINLYKLIFGDKIITERVHIFKPIFSLVSKNPNDIAPNSKSLNNFWNDFYSSISLKNVSVSNGELLLQQKKSKANSKWQVGNINLHIDNVTIDSSRIYNPIPFKYDSFNLSTGNIKVKVSDLYEITIQKISRSDKETSIHNVKMTPLIDFEAYNDSLPYEKGYFNNSVKKIAFFDNEWSYIGDTILLKSKKLKIDSLTLDIKKDKRLKDNPNKKLLYAELLRSIPFYISVDSVSVNSSTIIYAEKRKTVNEASVSLNNIHANILHLNNTPSAADTSKTTLLFKSMLFNESPLNATLSFHVNDPVSSYILNGHVKNFNLNNLNKFTLSVLHASVEGYFPMIDFKIHANDNNSFTTLNLGYKNLKVDFKTKRKPHKSNFIKNLTANILLKNNKNEVSYDSSTGKHTRNKQKSIYVQMVRSILEASKGIFIKIN